MWPKMVRHIEEIDEYRTEARTFAHEQIETMLVSEVVAL